MQRTDTSLRIFILIGGSGEAAGYDNWHTWQGGLLYPWRCRTLAGRWRAVVGWKRTKKEENF